MSDATKKRGRPRLTEEEKESRRIKRNAYKQAYDKANGYPYQKKYRESLYEIKIRIPIEKKDAVRTIADACGLTISKLFVCAVEDKYGIKISCDAIDK